MKQLTIRGFDKELEAAIRALARREGVSLSQATLRLLRSAAGVGAAKPRRDVVGGALDGFIGTWTSAQAKAVTHSTKDLERLDPAFWR